MLKELVRPYMWRVLWPLGKIRSLKFSREKMMKLKMDKGRLRRIIIRIENNLFISRSRSIYYLKLTHCVLVSGMETMDPVSTFHDLQNVLLV